MKTIWKFPLEITDSQDVQMPAGAEVLGIAEQYGELCMWAIVDTDADLEARSFAVVGTGNPIPDDVVYVSSTRMPVGDVIAVWHVFERDIDE
jgi:hypothetical protein